MKKIVASLLLAGCAHLAWADGLQSLEGFMKTAKSGSAEFTQTVTSPPREGQAARSKTSSGSFEFQRPGRFKFVYRKPFERMTQSQNDPVFREFWPENAVIMNSGKAAEMDIAEGDEVFVESDAGKIKLKAKLLNGIRPDCVAIDHGFGHWSPGYSVAAGVGANAGELIPAMTIEEQLVHNTPDMAAYMEDVALKVYKA